MSEENNYIVPSDIPLQHVNKVAHEVDYEIKIPIENEKYVNTSELPNSKLLSSEKDIECSTGNTMGISNNPEDAEGVMKKVYVNITDNKTKSKTHNNFKKQCMQYKDCTKNTEIFTPANNKDRKSKHPEVESGCESIITTNNNEDSHILNLGNIRNKTIKKCEKGRRLRKQLHEKKVLSYFKLNKLCTKKPRKQKRSGKITKAIDIVTNKDVEPITSTSTLEIGPFQSSLKTVKKKMLHRKGGLKASSIVDCVKEDDQCGSKNENNILDTNNISEQTLINTLSSTISENNSLSILIEDRLNKPLSTFDSKDNSLDLFSYNSGCNTKVSLDETSSTASHAEDQVDEICLNRLKQTKEVKSETIPNINLQSSKKRNSKQALMSDFEYNLDCIMSDSICQDKLLSSDKHLQLFEEGTKRSARRSNKQPLHYDECSDEDPYANIELSDDEAFQGKKGAYYSDYEYVPDKKKNKYASTDSEVSSDSETKVTDDEQKKTKSKKVFKKVANVLPKNKLRKSIIQKLSENSIKPSDEIEKCNSTSNTWDSSNEFQNFIARRIQGTNLKIKKVSLTEKTEKNITPLKIPSINPNEPKKTLEMSSQTNSVATSVAAVQTTARYDIPLKENVPLTIEQSQKGCEFLKSIVKTTAELGQLMTQKSEDFIKKKINNEHITDMHKVDYCVKKTFLLLKLAKHNLTHMEEDLAQQYDLFLDENKLTHCREEQLQLLPTLKDSDSDCEIVEQPEVPIEVNKKSASLAKFNPKTVFLNKELSIKIAKKPSEEKKFNIKGRNTVWINDSVMVKKVKPTQSFLSQDSRNKKPPDYKYVTLEMVRDFFDKYHYQKVMKMCIQFTSKDWFTRNKNVICYYSAIKPDSHDADSQSLTVVQEYTLHGTGGTEINSDTNPTLNGLKYAGINSKNHNPKSLLTLCVQVIQNHTSFSTPKNMASVNDPSTYLLTDEVTNNPKTLMQLSLKVVNNAFVHEAGQNPNKELTCKVSSCVEMPSLIQLCYKRVKTLFFHSASSSESVYHCNIDDSDKYMPCKKTINNNDNLSDIYPVAKSNVIEIKSLFTLCTNVMQTIFSENTAGLFWDSKSLQKSKLLIPKSLKHITYKYILSLLNINNAQIDDSQTKCNSNLFDSAVTNLLDNNEVISDLFNINSVNTLSEEAFFMLNTTTTDDLEHCEDLDNYVNDNSTFNDCEFEGNAQSTEYNLLESTSWVSHLQMKDLKSGVTLTTQNTDHSKDLGEVEMDSSIQIKLEQVEEMIPNIIDVSVFKTEYIPGLDEMTIIPENFVTKIEEPECSDINNESILRCSSSGYDATVFEDFLSCNKLIPSQSTNGREEVFSQSVLRVSGFHEPDYESEHETIDSLLIPQAYKTLQVENAKNCLMESNSDNDNPNIKIGRKKIDKRKIKRKTAKLCNKNSILLNKELEKSQSNNEVVSITNRMRETIRQKQKELASSDSEVEDNLNMNFKNAENIKKCKIEPVATAVDSEIQCNDVDSTQKTIEMYRTTTNNDKILGDDIGSDKTEPLFNLIKEASYNEFMKKKICKRAEKIAVDTIDEPHVSSINFNSSIEQLECEPIMPIFDELITSLEEFTNCAIPKHIPIHEKVQDSTNHDNTNTEIVDQQGWQCYKIDCNDIKLVQNVKIILEKLPETFVETYLQYQDIMDEDDLEIKRLINLNSLKRPARDNKPSSKNCKVITEKEKLESIPSEHQNREVNGCESENFEELALSEDEDSKVCNKLLPSLPVKAPENNIAKDCLMNDNDSDDGTVINKIEEEPTDEIIKLKRRVGPKSKTVVAETDNLEVMLTADKVMNKELTLMNGPVSFNNKGLISSNEIVNKKMQKTSPTKAYSTRERIKVEKEEGDYSSEEEKRWFNTKEKLLKSMDKKDSASVCDAKHAKLVTEFIEKRSDKTRIRKSCKYRSRRNISKKKMIEQQKQLSVLYNDLYGGTLESATSGHNYGLRYTKSQRNSGKVTGKKNQKSKTEQAYPILFEESERTKRLYARQAQLRELLGCNENETVQVIEDKVCLEYDFETKKPVVSVHAFFTEVMKEHQYAGVKFMWDACFESLDEIEKGHLGSGCILAHCMGLGKTLQVLALLHTVMTHPRVGMRRVLVCCPLSTVLNWVDEIHKWIGPVTNKIKVFELSKLKKTNQRAYQLDDWFKGGGIFIIGYELFRSLTTLDPSLDSVRPNVINKIRSALLDPGPDIIVCDEGHLLKNDYSILTMAMSRVATKRRIVLTGTPMQNNLREYYCMVNFIKPNLLGTYTEFYKRFENPIINGQHRDSTEEDTRLMNSCTYILHKVLEGCLQRHEVSVMYPYLPKKHEYTVFVTLTKYQWDMYKHYMYNYSKKANQNVLKDFNILHKIWSHPQILDNFQTKSLINTSKLKEEKLEDDLAQEDLAADIKPSLEESWWLQYLEEGKMLDSIESSNKFVAVFRILEECVEIGNKVLIFSTSLFTLDSLEYFLKKINNWELGKDYYRLDGSVPAEVRQKWCREFNAENNHKTKLFLISTRAGCLGLNMTAANRVIILDTSWNPAHDIQSIFRVYRFGQKRDCYIYRLVAMGTMEQKIYERSVTKQAVACRVLDEQQIDRLYNSADLNELYLYDETGMTVPAGVSVGVDDAVILRVARDAPIHAVLEHDSLLRGTSEQGLPEHERHAAWNKFQQEHAQKQMKNKSCIKKPQKQLKILKESTANCNNEEAISNEYVKDESQAVSKAPTPVVNRGRKAVVANCCIPIRKDEEPGPSYEPVPASTSDIQEDDLVQKISTMLVKHNYYYKDEAKTSELINKVLNIIRHGDKYHDDELSQSIADILLLKETVESVPPCTVSESTDTFNCIAPNEENKRRKRKSENSVKDSASLPDAHSETLTDKGKKNKKKAASAAENRQETNVLETHKLHVESYESLSDKSLNASKTNEKSEDKKNNTANNLYLVLEPNSLAKVNDSVTNQIHLENVNNKKRKSSYDDEGQAVCNSQLSSRNKQSATLDGSKKKRRKYLTKNAEDLEPNKHLIDLTDTIDTEDNKETKKKSGVVFKTTTANVIDLTDKPKKEFKKLGNKSNPVNAKTRKETDREKQCALNDNVSITEMVPLHPSILKNENFIKIVAHKYVKDNPMMTQQVAVLSARLKINAALEICESGTAICNGEIYDKAVEILGIEMLKELHKMGEVNTSKSQVQEPTHDVQARTAESLKNASIKPFETNSVKVTKIPKIDKPDTASGSFQVYQMRSKASSSVASKPVQAQSPQLNCDVVPVGLFKGPANIQATGNYQQGVECNFLVEDEHECILPDDEGSPASSPLKIISHRNTNSPPPLISIRSETSLASDSTTTSQRLNQAFPFKVSSEPKKKVTVTRPFAEVTMPAYSNRKTVQPSAPLSPFMEEASYSDKDIVVILSDDEDTPLVPLQTRCLPVMRPSDGGPIPVALTAAGSLHTSPSQLTVLKAPGPRSRTQAIPTKTGFSVKDKVIKKSLHVSRELLSSPPLTPMGTAVHSSSTSSKPRRALNVSATDKTNSSRGLTSGNISNLKIPDLVLSKAKSIPNYIVHMDSNHIHSAYVTEAVPTLKQSQRVKPIPVVSENTNAPATSDKNVDNAGQEQTRMLKSGRTYNVPEGFKITEIPGTTQRESDNVQSKNGMIIDLTDECSTSDQMVNSAANSGSTKSYNRSNNRIKNDQTNATVPKGNVRPVGTSRKISSKTSTTLITFD